MTYFDNRKVYNSRCLNNYVRLFRDKYSHVDIFELLSEADIKPEQINNDYEWFTQDQINRFHAQIGKHFDNPEEIAREAGRNAFTNKDLGKSQKLAVNIFGVGFIYDRAFEFANNLTKTCKFSSKKIAKNKYEIICQLEPWVTESPLQEHNRIGMLEAAPLLFCDELAVVEPKIEGKTHRYIVHWKKTTSMHLYLVKNITFYLSIPSIALFMFFSSALYTSIASAIILIIILSLNYWFWLSKYKESIKIAEIQKKNIDIILKNHIDDNNLLDQLNRFSNEFLGTNDLDKSVREISKILSLSDYSKIAIFITDMEGDFISLNHSINFSEKLKHAKFTIDETSKYERLFMYHYFEDSYILKSRFPISVHGLFDDEDFPLIYWPIKYADLLIGFLWLSPRIPKNALKEKSIKFLTGLSQHFALGIHRAMAYQTLSESDKIKSDIISSASHELNTPIQIMYMACSDLEATGDINSNLPILKGELLKLKATIKTFLDFKKSTKADLELSDMPISDFFDKLKKSVNNTEKIFNHSLTYEYKNPELIIRCDIDKIITAILNLFTNSCKYTPQGGKIIIRHTDHSNSHLFEVIDNGIGIPIEDQKRVFIKFYQCDRSKNNAVGGVGLGLSIAERFIRLHGGDINIVSPIPPEYTIPTDFFDKKNRHNHPGTSVCIHLPK